MTVEKTPRKTSPPPVPVQLEPFLPSFDPSFLEFIARIHADSSDTPASPGGVLPWEFPELVSEITEPSDDLSSFEDTADHADGSGDTGASTLYQSHDAYEWLAGNHISDVRELMLLGTGSNSMAYIKSGNVVDRSLATSHQRTLVYVCKLWPAEQITVWDGFFRELALYKSTEYLRTLQGTVVPRIIGVFKGDRGVSVSMEAPHPVWWFEASAFMPDVLKAKVIAAYELIHAKGVLHGDVALRHILIGGDARVSIIDFQESRAIVSKPAVELRSTTADKLAREMRRVRYVLDFEGARATEDARTRREVKRRSLNKATRREIVVRKVAGQPYDDLTLIPRRRGHASSPPIPPDELEEWKKGCMHPPRHFVMPNVDASQLSDAIVEFCRVVCKMIEDGESWGATGQSPNPSPPSMPASPVEPVQFVAPDGDFSTHSWEPLCTGFEAYMSGYKPIPEVVKTPQKSQPPRPPINIPGSPVAQAERKQSKGYSTPPTGKKRIRDDGGDGDGDDSRSDSSPTKKVKAEDERPQISNTNDRSRKSSPEMCAGPTKNSHKDTSTKSCYGALLCIPISTP